MRFTDEFKRDAAQVVERGYAVSERAVRLGIGTKSLYPWNAQFSKSPRPRNRTWPDRSASTNASYWASNTNVSMQRLRIRRSRSFYLAASRRVMRSVSRWSKEVSLLSPGARSFIGDWPNRAARWTRHQKCLIRAVKPCITDLRWNQPSFTPFSTRSPRVLSTLRQYSNARF